MKLKVVSLIFLFTCGNVYADHKNSQDKAEQGSAAAQFNLGSSYYSMALRSFYKVLVSLIRNVMS